MRMLFKENEMASDIPSEQKKERGKSCCRPSCELGKLIDRSRGRRGSKQFILAQYETKSARVRVSIRITSTACDQRMYITIKFPCNVEPHKADKDGDEG
jgi:hypothetical protein